MTRSLTIVNTSNWDGEDYDVLTRDGWKTIKPGELVVAYPDNFEDQDANSVHVRTCRIPSKPFCLNGTQVMPRVNVGFK